MYTKNNQSYSVLCLIFSLMFGSLSAFGQQATFEGMKGFDTADEIENVGFYAVYEESGQKGKIRNYTLRFFDYDYKETNSEKIELSKIATVASSATNQTHLAVAFSDTKLKQISVKSFDKEGNLAGELDLSQSAFPNATVYKAPGGFVIVNEIRKSAMSMKIKYEVIAVDNNLKERWKLDLSDDLVREVIDVVSSADGTALVYTTGKGMKKENYDQHMVRVDEDGKMIYDEVFANNYYYFPNKILLDGDNTMIFGSFPVDKRSKPAGVFAIAFDESGDITMKKEIDFEKEISPEIKDIMIDEDINMKEIPQFIVNDAIKTDDGFILITETIRLRPSIGASVQVSTGGSGGGIQNNTAFFMGDFIVLNFSQDLNLDRIQVVTKDKNKVVFEGTIINVNQYHHILKENDVSNYQFWVTNDKGNPSMVYTIRKSYRSNIQIGVVDLTKTDKVIESKPVDSDLEKMKEVGDFGVLKNTENKLTVFIYKRGVLSFYDLSYE